MKCQGAARERERRERFCFAEINYSGLSDQEEPVSQFSLLAVFSVPSYELGVYGAQNMNLLAILLSLAAHSHSLIFPSPPGIPVPHDQLLPTLNLNHARAQQLGGASPSRSIVRKPAPAPNSVFPPHFRSSNLAIGTLSPPPPSLFFLVPKLAPPPTTTTTTTAAPIMPGAYGAN